jgi:hypothetical protein
MTCLDYKPRILPKLVGYSKQLTALAIEASVFDPTV